MWLPRPVYEAMPYAFGAAGAGLILLAFRVAAVPQEWLFGAGGGLATLGLVLWMKRRDYRSNHSEYDPHSLDE
jgi:hypothetical protein